MHEIGVYKFALDRHNIAQQPYVQAQVVGQAAQQGHSSMCVCVDQAGHEHFAAAVDRLFSGVFFFDLGFITDCEDRISLYRQRAGLVHVVFFIHRDKDGVG